MRWVVDDLKLLASSREASAVAATADPEDETYLVPAFTGLGAPYWESRARAVICGMGRRTGRAEIVRAAEDCIAYQIADVVRRMGEEGGIALQELRVDGGPTRDAYLMQFQSDLLGMPVQVPDTEELSGIGAAYAAGIAVGLYGRDVFARVRRTAFVPGMAQDERTRKLAGWQAAVDLVVGDAQRRKQEENP
jgi:glycerol kinase